MATLLRRPGNLARIARRPTNSIAHVSVTITSPFILQLRLSPLITARRIRYYSTPSPGGPNPPKNGGDQKPDQGDGKPPGSKLSEEDQKLLDQFIKESKEVMPESRWYMVDELGKEFARRGVPDEFREIMKRRNAEGAQQLSVMELFRIFKALGMHMFRNSGPLNDLPQRGPSEEPSKNENQQQKQQQQQQEQPQQEKEEESQEQRQKRQQEQEREQQQKQQNMGGKGQQPKKPQPNVYEFKFDTVSLLISAVLTYYLWQSLYPGETRREITWQEFRSKFFDKGLVEKLTVLNGSRVRVELNKEAVSRVYPDSQATQPGFYYYFTIGSVESFDRRLDEAQNELGIPNHERIPVSYVEEVSWFGTFLSLGPTLLMLGMLAWASRRVSGGANNKGGIFGIGKSRAKRFNHETDIKIKFSDVAGMDEAKVEIMEFVSFLKQPERFQKLGAKIPRGAILSGPPGTGKTLLAKATAGESGVPFFSVSGSEFVEMFVGVGPSRVRDLFANARKNTPCIIFIDEIDAIGKSRAKKNFGGGGNDERESTLNQILTEMDGFNTSEQVVVLAGTNRADVLDKALLRPGRFDRHITIDRPTMDGRKQIFGVHLRKIVTNEDMEYLKGRLAALTPGFSGADIANCVNEAALVGM